MPLAVVLGAVLMVVMVAVTTVVMMMAVLMIMVVLVAVAAVMTLFMLTVLTILILAAAKPHMHLHALNAVALLGLALQTIFVFEPKLGKLCLQVVWAHTKINHGGEVHVAADSGKAVVVENLHITPVKKVQPGRDPITSSTGCPILAERHYRSFAQHKK